MDTNYYMPSLIEEYAFDESLTGRQMVFLAGPRQVRKTMLDMEVKSADALLSSPLKDPQKWFLDTPTLGAQVVEKRGVGRS